MSEAAQTEFWRDIKPIEQVFRRHSLEEMFTPDIATDDERFYVPLSETVVYETPGEAHTLVAYESDEPMKVHFKVKGPLIWPDENGDAVDYFDVHDYIDICKEHYEKVGLGADAIDALLR